MPPEVTRAAAEYVDARIAESFLLLVVAADSPILRAHLAETGARQPHKTGGAGIATYVATSITAHISSVASAWPKVARIFPPLAAVSLSSSTDAVASAFRKGYEHIDAMIARVRSEFEAIDAQIYYDINGAKHQAYHPALPKPFLRSPLPALSELWRDTDSKTPSCLRQKVLSMVAHCSSWLEWIAEARAFDAANGGATVPSPTAKHAASSPSPSWGPARGSPS